MQPGAAREVAPFCCNIYYCGIRQLPALYCTEFPHDKVETPEEMENIFQQLVLPGVWAIIEGTGR